MHNSAIILDSIITASPEPMSGYIGPLLPNPTRWLEVAETNGEARGLFRRHDAWRLNGKTPRSFAGGERLILMTPQADALMVFARRGYSADPLTTGVQVTAFRNEGHFRSCSLIREAVHDWAARRWPGERLFVLVPGCRVVASNPGYSFRLAGWRRCGVSRIGSIVLVRHSIE